MFGDILVWIKLPLGWMSTCEIIKTKSKLEFDNEVLAEAENRTIS
jgi:hypothetical protein